jgi:hypothetical protein
MKNLQLILGIHWQQPIIKVDIDFEKPWLGWLKHKPHHLVRICNAYLF